MRNKQKYLRGQLSFIFDSEINELTAPIVEPVLESDSAATPPRIKNDTGQCPYCGAENPLYNVRWWNCDNCSHWYNQEEGVILTKENYLKKNQEAIKKISVTQSGIFNSSQ